MTQVIVDPQPPSNLSEGLHLSAVPPGPQARPMIRPRRWLYPLAVFLFVGGWLAYMTVNNRWGLYDSRWPMALTMLGGSFVAGATPMGGASVAFPVFTKILQIPAADSRTFGLMIQSVGMTMASLFILTRGIRVLPEVIAWGTLGGFGGMLLGTYGLVLPDPYPRVLFSLGVASYAVAQVVSRWVLKAPPRAGLPPKPRVYRLALLLVGLGGGYFAAHTGSGVDMMCFILITLAFAVDEKIGTPTSVVIMALTSLFGFFLHGAVSGDIGIVWEYWLVAAPVVAFGAPLGAFFASRVPRDILIIFTLALIGIEFVTTLILVPFTPPLVLAAVLVTILCGASFWGMLFYRRRFLDR